MKKINEFVPFVKDQAIFHQKMAEKYLKIPARKQKHLETASTFIDMVESFEKTSAEILELSARLAACEAARPSPKAIQLSLNFDEIEGLPDELVKELSISDADRTDYAVVRIIDAAGGVASLDRILVALYRETGEIHKRTAMTSRIYRMSQKNLVFSVPNKKGVYSTTELTPEEAGLLV